MQQAVTILWDYLESRGLVSKKSTKTPAELWNILRKEIPLLNDKTTPVLSFAEFLTRLPYSVVRPMLAIIKGIDPTESIQTYSSAKARIIDLIAVYDDYLAERFDNRLFRVEKDLVTLFQNTDLPADWDASVEQIRLPFPAFKVTANPGAFTGSGAIYNNVEITVVDPSLHYTGSMEDDRRKPLAAIVVQIYVEGDRLTLEHMLYGVSLKEEIVSTGEALEQSLAQTFDASFVTKMSLFLKNLLLYLNYEKDDIVLDKSEANFFHQQLQGLVAGKKRDSLLKRHKEAKSKFIYIVGGKAHISNEEREELQTALLRKSPSPHWRRGHWRRTHYGPERINIKRVFIRPVFVNKQLGSVPNNKSYVVK